RPAVPRCRNYARTRFTVERLHRRPRRPGAGRHGRIARVANLTHHSVIAQLLNEYGLQPDKRFGQNFLVDPSVIAASLQAANVQPGDTVLEIGPGLGVLTRELLSRAGTVHAIEYDERL